ncbi:MAG: hypothetical protein VB064_06405 [Oscillospiraceae bacterium]|nr:hypothetical protein [Oscillospiraceae bacterium]
MDNNNENNMNTDDLEDLSLDSILADFKAEKRIEEAERGDMPLKSRPIVMDDGDQAIAEADFSSLNSDSLSHIDEQEKMSPVFTGQNERQELTQSFSRESYSASKVRRTGKVPANPDDTVIFKRQPADDETQFWSKAADGEQKDTEYAPPGNYEPEEDPDDTHESKPGFREKILSPLIGLAAASDVKREEKRRAEKSRAEKETEKSIPEMSPEKASRLYMDQALSIRLRCLFASFLSIVLVWLSYGLPAMGLLGQSALVRTMVCLILELIVILIGLDIFTNGLVSLFKRNSGSETLISVSCLVSIIDAVYILISKNTGDGLPFCAVSALSVTFALWGSYLECRSFAISFRTAAIPKAPFVVISEDGGEELGRVLAKVQRPVTGFVRKSEEADIFENGFSLFTPLFIIFAVVLSLFCFLGSDRNGNLIHTLAAGMTICASFSAVFGFAFPYYVITKRLARSGVAIAGYSGCADLGRLRQVVIKDRDIFPERTLSIANITVTEGFYPDKVISFTSSMVAASGMGISSVFTELMKKNGYSMQKVEDFACHEGGGIIARINGETVYVGSSSFMQLMGIRVKKGTGSLSAVFTAINDTLAGVFEINYLPVSSVQKGLVTLLRGKVEPVFAIRDFNITPMLVRQKFRLPKESYDFPSFADRYAISSPETEDTGSVVAMFSRGGLNSVAGLVKRGTSLYNGLLLCAVLSILGAFLGMLFMFTMCWSGSFSSASCGNAITFMLLWLVPVLVISYGLRR